jgi:hypothetical protein
LSVREPAYLGMIAVVALTMAVIVFAGAVKTIFECIGEDPEKEGLRETPERYANSLMYFTKGYEENVRDLVNGAVFHEDHDELVIVKDIEVFSLCEHHMVPFTGKVGAPGPYEPPLSSAAITVTRASDVAYPTNLFQDAAFCQDSTFFVAVVAVS